MSTSATPPTANTTSSRAPSLPLSTSQPSGQPIAAITTHITVVNTEPVELDSTPVSPVDARKPGFPTSGGFGALTGGSSGGSGVGNSKKGFSPDYEDEVIEEMSGEKVGGVVEREKRAALLNERSRNPAVLVNIPETPAAEELEVANRAAADAHADVETKD